MAYFGMQHQVLFHDTMAYGSQHHTVNIKLQNIAREIVLFESRIDGKVAWEEQLADIVMLTREVFCLNLAPVQLAEKVAVLMTYEEPTRSTMRLCFRIVKSDGQPASCGYQTMIVMHKDTHELVPAPRLLTQYLDASSEKSLLEPLRDPSFAERAKAGGRGVKEIFCDEVVTLGQHVAQSPLEASSPRIIDRMLNEYSL